MAYFLARLAPPRPGFPADMTAEEGVAMQAHAGYWTARAAQGAAVAVGPVFDPAGAWGMAVLDCADAAAARRLVDADPVIGAALGFRYDVFPIPSLILRGAGAPPTS
jgi:hypothetical protein